MKKKIITFDYRSEIIKEIRIRGHSSPYTDLREAIKDIESAIQYFQIKDKLEEGVNLFQFTACFIPNDEGIYDLNLKNYKLEKIEDNVKVEFIPFTLWQKIKRYVKRLKVKRFN